MRPVRAAAAAALKLPSPRADKQGNPVAICHVIPLPCAT